MQRVKEKLYSLAVRNSDPNYVNKNLYRFLFNKEMFILAYEHIRPNKGLMTHGSDKKSSVDGIDLQRIDKLIEDIKTEKIAIRPSRRIDIPKKNGKTRPLGLPDFEEKLVQQCVYIILECIYDSNAGETFSRNSFGFRKQMGCHHAARHIKDSFNGRNWIISADVKGFFDNVNHHILISLLKKRIDDSRFINLIWKFLKAGVLIDKMFERTDRGTPQGGVASPILANIYLHEFDEFVQRLIVNYDGDMITNKKYGRLKAQRLRIGKRINDLDGEDPIKIKGLEEMKLIRKVMFSMPSTVLKNPNSAKIKYVRYADDWLIGIKGSKSVAENIYDKCMTFFKDSLALEWNLSKSYLANTQDKDFRFLGYDIHFVRKNAIRATKVYNPLNSLPAITRTVNMNAVNILAPKEHILQSLREKGFLSGKAQPIAKTTYMNMDAYTIVQRYNSVRNGILNYYKFVHNVKPLHHISYLLHISLICTLGRKFKCSGPEVYRKFGKKVIVKRADGKKEVSFPYVKEGFKRNVRNFLINEKVADFRTIFYKGIRDTTSFLKHENCCICGVKGDIEIHHVKHIRRKTGTYVGFQKILGRVNRKSIPVCKQCHLNIHNGKYDGGKLSNLESQIIRRLNVTIR